MTAIDFPNDPDVDDTYTVGDVTWVWTGDVWKSLGTLPEEVNGNLDGGKANTVYGGISPILGGNAEL
jgi:hypothetical protein